MQSTIKRLGEYKPKKEEYEKQKTSVLSNVKEFFKGREMILIAFENGAFPLAEQYPSEDLKDWKEDETESATIPEKAGDLLPSKKRKTEKEKLLKK